MVWCLFFCVVSGARYGFEVGFVCFVEGSKLLGDCNSAPNVERARIGNLFAALREQGKSTSLRKARLRRCGSRYRMKIDSFRDESFSYAV